jgi:sugar-specific transcriptional regulator TrmB
MDIKILEELGLTFNESKVYLSLIELGSSSATQIIQKVGLHRAVVYDLLERLIEKGLAGYVINGRKKFFEATNPEKLKEILQEKEQKLSEILPQLLELSKFKTKLEVKIYKGKEGIKNVFEDILRNKPKEWLSLGSGGETYRLLPYFLEHFHKARIKNKIFVRGLFLDNSNAKKRGEALEKMPFSEIRYLPKTFLTPTVMNVYSNKVTLYSVTEGNIPFIILIENKELFSSFKEYFEWLWKLSKNRPL